MSIEDSRIQRLRVDVEAGGSFAVDGTGTLGNYRDVPAIEGSISQTADQEMLNPETVQQRLDARPVHLLGIKSCSVGFGVNFAPTGVAASASVAAVSGVMGEMLDVVMGGSALGTGTTINDVAATARVFDLTAPINKGTAIGWINSAGILEARELANQSGAEHTLKHSFSAAPADTDPIYAAATYHLAQNPAESLQFILEGAEASDAWLFSGCQAESLAFEFPLGQLPRVTFSMAGVDWDQVDGVETAGTATTSPASAATYSNIAEIHTVGTFTFQDATSTAAPTALCISDFTFAPNLSYIPVPCPSASSTHQHVTDRWRRQRQPTAGTGSFTVPFEDASYWADWKAGTLKSCFFQIGTTPGNTILFSMPNVQIMNVQRVDAGGIVSQQVSFELLEDAYVTGAATDRGFSAWRVHLL